jgi:tetratricopeptide (TPR) repeat protein
MSSYVPSKQYVRLIILVMAVGTIAAAESAVAQQANEEYEMVCELLPPPEGWQMDPEAQDAEAPPEELICIRDIQLNSAMEGYQRIAIWLDMPMERRDEIAHVQYYLGDEFEEPVVIPDWVSAHEAYIQFFFVRREFDFEVAVTFDNNVRIVLEEDLEFEVREEINPADHYFLAHLLVKENQPIKALSLLGEYPDEVAAFQPAMTLRGLAHLRLGNFDAALADLRQATQIDPESAAGWGMLARVILEDIPDPSPEQLEEARAAARQAVDIRRDPEYLDALGWAHHVIEEDDEALRFLLEAQEAIKSIGKDHSTYEAIHYHLAEVYLRREQFEDAKEQYEEVVDFFDKYPGTNRRYYELSKSRLEELKRRRQ